MWTTLDRWWNDTWGLGRRVLRLRTDGHVWRVEAAEGNGDAKTWQRDYLSEWEARTIIEAFIARATDNGGRPMRSQGGGD